MEILEIIYTTIVGGTIVILMLRGIISWAYTNLAKSFRPRLVNLTHPILHKGKYCLSSPLNIFLVVLFLSGMGACNTIGVQSLRGAGSRAARLSLINLLPMFLSGGYESGARLLGVSLETYGTIHRILGFTAFAQAAFHTIIAMQRTTASPSDNLQFYGILVCCP